MDNNQTNHQPKKSRAGIRIFLDQFFRKFLAIFSNNFGRIFNYSSKIFEKKRKNLQKSDQKNSNTGSKIPCIFVAFFALFIAVDVIYIYVAKKTWRGTVTENAYEKGLKYNQTLISDKKQKDLGFKAKLNIKSINNKTTLLSFDLKDKNGKIIKDAKIKINLVRPTQTGFDFAEELLFETKNQNYQKIINFPLKGLWKVELQAFVTINGQEEIFQYVERIIID